MTEGYVEIGGGRIHYELTGSGPDIVFVHGFSLDMRSWDKQVEAFAGHYRILRYDLRGFGGSSLPSDPYDHCEDLAALMDRLDIRRPVLVGLSLGANIALRFCLTHQERIAGCVLASPGLPGYPWREVRPPDAARAYAHAHGVEVGKLFWLGHPLFASLSKKPEARAATHAMVADYSGWHWQHGDPQKAAINVAERLSAATVPILILSGAHDVEGYREIAQILGTRIAGATVEVIGTTGHMINLEEPELFNDRLRAFAREIGQPAVKTIGGAA
jgi:3-oxoadipate enol-lactonase